MATEPNSAQQPPHPDNTEARRHERRAEANEQYRREGDDQRQGGPDPDLAHRLRTRGGDGAFDPHTIDLEDGTTNGVAKTVTGDGQNSNKRGFDTEQNANKAPDRLDARNVAGGDLKD